MSGKAAKRARRQLKGTVAALDARKRAARHCPRWRIWALALGIEGPTRRWNAAWERKHATALKAALKETVRYKMRSGAQPLATHTAQEGKHA